MISILFPSADRIDALFGELAVAEYSYPDVGATRGAILRECRDTEKCGEVEKDRILEKYNVDRYSAILGNGDAVFESAKNAIRDWKPFHLPWIRVVAPSEPAPGVLVAVVVRIVGLWWTNVSRVLYTVDDANSFGFAYGTLPIHAETGEELFMVERSAESGDVTYRILAFSRPRHPLARLGYPLSRAAQRRFGAGSIEAMKNVTSTTGA